MTQAITSVKDLTGRLAGSIDSSRISVDPDFLARYATDTSYTMNRKPDMAVKVLTTEEVQQVVTIANENRIPVVPKSSGVGFYGAAIPEQGGIVVDMSGMKKIRRIDKRNKWALFEAGVTYGELQAELGKEGMRAMIPLLPHRDKSVITSCLEREPRLTPKHHLDETILTMEMVLPNGNLFHTGSMSIDPMAPEKIPDEVPCDLCNFMGPGVDWFRLVPGSLGTYGIVTVMNVKAGFVPTARKVMFMGFDRLEDCVAPLYHIERKLIGDECLLLNSRYLASILAPSPEDVGGIAAALPPYVIVLNLTAGEWYPEEKMAYQEEALHEAAKTFLFTPMETLPNVPDAAAAISQYLYQPWDGATYWKAGAKGASREIFFLTQLQRAPEFLQVIRETAHQERYPLDEIGLYLQPKQNGRAFHMEASFPFNPEDPEEKELIDTVCKAVSRALVQKGAFFYRIYGDWDRLVYPRTGTLHETLKRIKGLLDPNKILNPGKLGF